MEWSHLGNCLGTCPAQKLMARLSSAVDHGENPCVGEGAKEHVGLSWEVGGG